MSMMSENEKYFTTSDGVKVRYVDVGEGEPLIYIPGYGQDGISFDGNELLEKSVKCYSKYFRFIVKDHRGWGKTPATGVEGGIHTSARDIQELIEHLGLEKVHLMGVSMGGAVSFSYIRQFGCDRLKSLIIADMTPKIVNEDGWNLGLYQGHYTRECLEADLKLFGNDHLKFQLGLSLCANDAMTPDDPRWDYVQRMESLSSDDLFAIMQKNMGVPDEMMDTLRQVFNGIVAVHASKENNTCYHYWKTMGEADNRDVLKDITVPTLLLYGDPGSIYQRPTAEYLAANISNATLQPRGQVHNVEGMDDEYCLGTVELIDNFVKTKVI